MTAPTDRVLSRAGRGLAELTLNRPEALNALSLDMIDGPVDLATPNYLWNIERWYLRR